MSRTLVRGRYVVSLADDAPVVQDGAVVVDGEQVVEVGSYAELRHHGPFDAELGDEHAVVMPGFINGHYHAECWTSPGMSGTIFELSNIFLGAGPSEVAEEGLELLATYGLVQALHGGQTGLVDAYYGKPGMADLGAQAVLRAYERTGQRVAFALSLRDQNTYVHQDDATFLAQFEPSVAAEMAASSLGYAWDVDRVLGVYEDLVERWEGRDGRLHMILAPDWTPACSDDLLRRARRTAAEHGAGLTIHVLETRSELYWNTVVNGRSAVRRLADLGVLGEDVSLGHFVWATDEDLDVFCGSGAVAVNNPGSNLRLSSGVARTADILDRGGRVCFGTDGISSTDREDFFAELRLALLLQRQPDVFSRHRLDSLQVLRAAGDNGSAALGWGERLGRLTPGRLADLLVLDGRRIFFPPGRHRGLDPLDVLLDRADHTDLRTVMVGGRVLLADGVVTSVDEDALLDRLAELGEEGLYGAYRDRGRVGELADLMVPPALAMYERWYDEPVVPRSVVNARHPQNPSARGGSTC